jgi:hypothetical protein
LTVDSRMDGRIVDGRKGLSECSGTVDLAINGRSRIAGCIKSGPSDCNPSVRAARAARSNLVRPSPIGRLGSNDTASRVSFTHETFCYL